MVERRDQIMGINRFRNFDSNWWMDSCLDLSYPIIAWIWKIRKNIVKQLLASPYMFIGSVMQIAEQLQRLREQFGISYFVVGSENMEMFAPVVARLAGI